MGGIKVLLWHPHNKYHAAQNGGQALQTSLGSYATTQQDDVTTR